MKIEEKASAALPFSPSSSSLFSSSAAISSYPSSSASKTMEEEEEGGSKDDLYGIFVRKVVHFLDRSLQRESSDVVWCEGEVRRYAKSATIAEYWNSVSNAVFFVFPPIFFVIWRPYARHVNGGCNVVWALLMVVGAGSFYFHATLSLFGQLLDELAILWVVLVAVATWIHLGKVFPILTCRRSFFKLTCYVFAVISSILNSTFPTINRVFLFSLGIPIVLILVIQVRRSTNERVRQLTAKSLCLYATAVTSWLNDRFLCQFWGKTAGFPYLHSIWHVLVFISCYATCVIFAYFDAIYTAEPLRPDIMYWPDDHATWIGIPYIGLRNPPSPFSEESPLGGVRAAFSPPGTMGLTAPINGVLSPPGVRLTQEFPRLEMTSTRDASIASSMTAAASKATSTVAPRTYQRRDDGNSAHSHSD